VLHEVAGDILLSKAQGIAHGVSPHDNFAQGLALALREQWPSLYQDFRHFCKTRSPDAGGLWAWMSADGRRVINLFTQEPPRSTGQHPGRATVKHIGHCLRELHKFVEAEGLKSLALPRLASGVGGLEWQEVEPLVHQHLGGLKIPVIIYTKYHKGEAAREPL
jgi:O-acetyl-ADP-ribose deacetylase (regulator of RNase III)